MGGSHACRPAQPACALACFGGVPTCPSHCSLAPLNDAQALSRADQQEVDANKAAVYLNLAALHLATQVGWLAGRVP